MTTLNFLRHNARFLGAGGLLAMSSSYGQTFFIAVFAGQIMLAYGLTDGEWGLVYTVATTTSAVVMLWAGALTDRFRIRRVALIVMPGLALVCLAMALSQDIATLIFVIFALRFFGQGMMSQLAIVSMARWFVARRGLALSIAALGFSLGQAVFPVSAAWLMDRMDWRMLWVLAAVLIMVTLPFVLRLLAAERTPQSLAREATAVGMDGHHWTRSEMLRDPLFWLLLPMLLGPPAWGTAVFFQQVHIATVKGWPLVDYLALVPLLTVIALITTVLSGSLIDRAGSGALARWYLVPFALAFFILAAADTLWMAALAMIALGVASGIQATLPAAFWAQFYGTRHIGAIKAVSTSIMVLGSAIGPGISGMLIDYGYPFPDQMVGIGAYFLASMVLVWLGVARALPRLATAP